MTVGCQETGPATATNKHRGPVVVSPGDNLQAALDLAASATEDRRLVLSEGTYRPQSPGFCILALTARHDGVVIDGQHRAVISGRSEIAPQMPMVSHAVYCGHGLTSDTVIRNLTIKQAGGYATSKGIPVEPNVESSRLKRGLFFQLDGGALKIFGRSSPTVEGIKFEQNETTLCGGAISIEHQGLKDVPVIIRNCQFIRNRCPATGAAVDILEGSAASISNSLFRENAGNFGMSEVKAQFGLSYNERHGSGALTVFPSSEVSVDQCTFIDNWNGVDDQGTGSTYERCLFIMNDRSDGSRTGHCYEMDVNSQTKVENCAFVTHHVDVNHKISLEKNRLLKSPPKLNENYVAEDTHLLGIGYQSFHLLEATD